MRIVVVGASAGGVEALSALVHGLPADLRAALFVVLHTAPKGYSLLPEILARAGNLPAEHPIDASKIEPGHIYVAPPDLHLLISKDRIHLSHGPRENGFRPAVDPLFRSAAEAYDGATIGVVLSGNLADGAAGLRAIKEHGGQTIVQDPDEAPFQSMPTSALELGPVDFTLPVEQIGPTIARLVGGRTVQMPNGRKRHTRAERALIARHPSAKPSPFTCPECSGTLWEIGGDAPQFRCRVGHSYSVSSLVDAQDDALERAIWAAVRSLEENGSLRRRLADDADKHNQAFVAKIFRERAREREQHAEVLRALLLEAQFAQDEARKAPGKKKTERA
jgi:two-component system chemotaxis response regulator CheB